MNQWHCEFHITSTRSAHCHEVVNATTEGGAGLTILSGLVAGNFSCFWKGLTLAILMLISYVTSTWGGAADPGSYADSLGAVGHFMTYPAVFAFGHTLMDSAKAGRHIFLAVSVQVFVLFTEAGVVFEGVFIFSFHITCSPS